MKSRRNGFTLVEILVGAGLFALVGLGLMTLTGNWTLNLKSAVDKGEVDDLRRLVRRQIDCKETIARNRVKCAANDPDDKSIALLSAPTGGACETISGTRGEYTLRASCRPESDYFVLDVEFMKQKPGRPAGAFEDLFDVPFTCRDVLPTVRVDVPHWCVHRWHGGNEVKDKPWLSPMSCDVQFSLRDYYAGPVDTVQVHYNWWGGVAGPANAAFGPISSGNPQQRREYDPSNPGAPSISCGSNERATHPRVPGGDFDFGEIRSDNGLFELSLPTGGSKQFGSKLVYDPDDRHTFTLENSGSGWGKCRYEQGCFACLSNIWLEVNKSPPPQCTP